MTISCKKEKTCYDTERIKIRNRILDQITVKYNSPRLATLSKADKLSLCLGAGASADINYEVNGNRYLWNGLVYGVCEKLLCDIVSMQPYKDMTSSFYHESPDEYNKHIMLLKEAIVKLSRAGDFLSTDNTMECVEYLKYLAFPHECGSIEETYSENVISLIVHKLINGNRYDMSKLSEGENSEFNDLVKREIAIERKSSYIGGKYQKNHGKTLIEVVELLERMLKCTKKVDVLTYNYDDFLETALDESNIKYNTIYDSFAQSDKKAEVNIYHVHGYIPGNWNTKIKLGDFIFSENSYNHMSDEIYRWANRVQADMFSKNRVLFVGFSGVDSNFRRLMKELKRIRNENNCLNHIMFMSYGKIVNNFCTNCFFEQIISGNSENESLHQGLELTIAQLLFEIIESIDTYYKSQLGIDLLWIDQPKDIADMLHEMCVV